MVYNIYKNDILRQIMFSHDSKSIEFEETKAGKFIHWGVLRYQSQRENCPYKLRLNIQEADYTEDTRQAVERLLKSLMEKYSIGDEGILSEFKSCLFHREDAKAIERKEQNVLDFWQALKANNRSQARQCANKIEDEKRKNKYLNEYIPDYFERKRLSKDKVSRDLEQRKNEVKCYLDSYYRMIGGTQFTLYLMPIYATNLAHSIRLLQFCRELNNGLQELRLRRGTVANTDSRITSYISFRQENKTGEEYVPFYKKNKLSALKKEQENSFLFKLLKSNFAHPKSYQQLWKAKETTIDKILNIVEDYTKSDDCTSSLRLFFTGHLFFNQSRHHVKPVRALVDKIRDNSMTVENVLKELDDYVSENKSTLNYNGSLFRRITFINEMCFDVREKLHLTRVKGLSS